MELAEVRERDRQSDFGSARQPVHGPARPDVVPLSFPSESSVSRQDLPQNPFRTPEALEKTKASRLRGLHSAARGLRIAGVDAKIILWLAQWLMLPILYQLTPLREQVWNTLMNSWSWDHVRVSTLITALVVFAVIYRRLYYSDPGYLGVGANENHLQMKDALPCPFCGSRPTSRSKHSKSSGQCVHKFDHSCWLLSTDIGDRNHGKFWSYLFLQTGFCIWAASLIFYVVSPCLALTTSRFHECELAGAPHVALLLGICFCIAVGVIPFFGYLLLLHTYLIISNQTTYEIISGAKIEYMSPFFVGRHAKKYWLPNDFIILLWDDLSGKGPPKPFSQGVRKNLAQITESWPRKYVSQT